MKVDFSGFCPTQNTDTTIRIDVIQADTLNGPNYAIGLFECDYLDNHDCSYAQKQNCPIYNLLKQNC